MITLADIHAAAANVTTRCAEKAETMRWGEADGLAWALANKTSYSDSVWKERHRASVRQRAAASILTALADEWAHRGVPVDPR